MMPYPPLPSRVAFVAACSQCAWRAQHTADTEDEVQEFLRRLLDAHILEVHAGAPQTS